MIVSLQGIAAGLPFPVIMHPQPVGRTAADCICPLVVDLLEARVGFLVSEIQETSTSKSLT